MARIPMMNIEVKVDGVNEVEVVLLMADFFSKKEEMKKIIQYRNFYMTEHKCKKGNCLTDREGEKIPKPDPATLCDCCKELHTIFKERARLRLKMRNIMHKVQRRLATLIVKTTAE